MSMNLRMHTMVVDDVAAVPLPSVGMLVSVSDLLKVYRSLHIFSVYLKLFNTFLLSE